MGSLFGRKSQAKTDSDKVARPEFEQLAYAAAYSLLPFYLFEDEVGGNRDLLVNRPRVGGLNLLVGACLLRQFEPDEPLMVKFSELQGHSGQLREGVQYRILEYPRPATPDVGDLAALEQLEPEQFIETLSSVVLAPYFSIVLLTEELQVTDYLVLGQSLDGATTLRQVTQSTNANLGPGCEPEFEALLSFLRALQEQEQDDEQSPQGQPGGP